MTEVQCTSFWLEVAARHAHRTEWLATQSQSKVCCSEDRCAHTMRGVVEHNAVACASCARFGNPCHPACPSESRVASLQLVM